MAGIWASCWLLRCWLLRCWLLRCWLLRPLVPHTCLGHPLFSPLSSPSSPLPCRQPHPGRAHANPGSGGAGGHPPGGGGQAAAMWRVWQLWLVRGSGESKVDGNVDGLLSNGIELVVDVVWVWARGGLGHMCRDEGACTRKYGVTQLAHLVSVLHPQEDEMDQRLSQDAGFKFTFSPIRVRPVPPHRQGVAGPPRPHIWEPQAVHVGLLAPCIPTPRSLSYCCCSSR